VRPLTPRSQWLVARDGWRLTPWYRFEPASRCGVAAGAPEPPLSLHDIAVGPGGLTYPAHRHREPESRLAEYLAEAERILADPVAALGPPPAPEPTVVDEDFEDLRWFWLPEEIAVQ
jgi:hypothetical protein